MQTVNVELRVQTRLAVNKRLEHHFGLRPDGTPREGRPEADEILKMIGQDE